MASGGRLGLASVGLVAVAIGLSWLAFDRTVVRDSALDPVRRFAGGRSTGYAALSSGLFPPRLLVFEPFLAEGSEGEPALRAARVELRLALWPLLRGVVQFEALLVEGLEMRLVHDPSRGLGLSAVAPPSAGPPRDFAPRPRSGKVSSAPSLARSSPVPVLQHVELRDSRLVVEDRSASPVAVWPLESLQASAWREADTPWTTFEATARVASGGRLRGRGRLHPDTGVTARIELESLEAAAFAPYLAPLAGLEGVAPLAGLEGVVDGTIELAGAGWPLDRVRADLHIAGLALHVAGARISGAMDLEANREASGGPLDFALSGELGDGGRLRAHGSLGPDAAMVLEVAVESLPLSLETDSLGALRRLDARVSGRLDWRREQATGGSLSAQLRLRDAAVRLEELSLRGPLELSLDLRSSTVAGPTGRFELDAGQAEVDYGGFARKAPGIPATLSGRIVDRRVEMARLHVEGFEATLPPGAGFSHFGRSLERAEGVAR